MPTRTKGPDVTSRELRHRNAAEATILELNVSISGDDSTLYERFTYLNEKA